MKRKLAAILALCVCAAMIFTACTSSPTVAPASATASPAASQTASAAATTAAATEPATKGEPTPLSVVVQHASWGCSDCINNTAREYFEKQMNVKLDIKVIEDTVMKEKVNLMFSSGDYPEVFFSSPFGNADLLKYGSQEKVLIPLNDQIDKNGVNIKKIMTTFPELRKNMTAPDGNIYGLPIVSDSKHEKQANKYWINQGWLDKVGLKMPTTTDELKAVLLAFKNKDPNGNGKADEIPLTGAINTWCADPWVYLMNSFVLCDPSNNFLILQNGQFTTCANDPKFQEGLRYIADLYNAGVIDPASFTQDLTQLGKLGNSPDDIVGCFAAGHLGMAVDITNNKDRAKQFTALPPVTGPEGFAVSPTAVEASIGWYPFAITDKCKNVDVAFRCGDYMLSDDWCMVGEYGTYGTDWTDAKPGDKGLLGGDAKYAKLNPPDAGKPNNRNWGAHNLLGVYLLNSHRDLLAVSQDMYDPSSYLLRLYKESDKYLPFKQKTDIIVPFWTNADSAAQLAQMGTDFSTYVKTSVVEFITGKRNIDTDWNAYLDGLKKVKMDEFLAAEKAAYDASQSK